MDAEEAGNKNAGQVDSDDDDQRADGNVLQHANDVASYDESDRDYDDDDSDDYNENNDAKGAGKVDRDVRDDNNETVGFGKGSNFTSTSTITLIKQQQQQPIGEVVVKKNDNKDSNTAIASGDNDAQTSSDVILPGKMPKKVGEALAVAALQKQLDAEEESPTARVGTVEELYPFRRYHAKSTTWLGWFKNLFLGNLLPKYDLDEETLEELRMATGFTANEVKHYRQLFLLHVQQRNWMTREEFMAIPSVYINPLRGQLAVCFGFSRTNDNSRISFRKFFETLSIFNNPIAPRDLKMKMAFTLQDFDGDNLLSKDDLVRYLRLITKSQEGTDLELDFVAEKILEEISSHPLGKFITLSDFSKVLVSADVVAKLMVPLTLAGDRSFG